MGFNIDNYQSFNTAYSTYKLKMGCKGIGRFLWLLAFDNVEIESNFVENGPQKRAFIFTSDGISPEDNCFETECGELRTVVKLNGYAPMYQAKCPVNLNVLANRIVEHCLPFFFSNACPEIVLRDGFQDVVNLNSYFKATIEPSLHQDHLAIKGEKFILYHLRIPEGATKHELHFCANLQDVDTVELKNYIPDLQKKIVPIDDPLGFYYLGYLTSPYLDSIVTSTRTGFDFDEICGQSSISGTGRDELIRVSSDYIKGYLADYITDISKSKRRQIDTFVAQDKPQYRYLLGKKPEIYDEIQSGLSPDKLELELHKRMQSWELEIKEQGKKLEKEIKKDIIDDQAAFNDAFEKYCSSITEISKTSLAEYVVRRKVLLDMLEQTLTIQDNGKFKKEDRIHTIICPMQYTSNDVAFQEMNLWIIDERLAYHKFLASDKTLKSMPFTDSQSTKEPDIAIFNQAFAYTDGDEPLNSVTIIEFKKPDNDSDNPVSQVGKYIDEIRSEKKKRANGLSFGASENTAFYCYVICDLSAKMKTRCIDASLQPMPDGAGYYGYNPVRKAYYEVISYPKLLSDARKRNQVLFDKLFSPKMDEIIHMPAKEQGEEGL